MESVQFHQGEYHPENPGKFQGRETPFYRSGWELAFMRHVDHDPTIVQWNSESLKIRYFNPVEKRMMAYVPDFHIRQEVDGESFEDVIEIKPRCHTLGHAITEDDKREAIVNDAKWAAAKEHCRNRGFGFMVLTENELFDDENGLNLARHGEKTIAADAPKKIEKAKDPEKPFEPKLLKKIEKKDAPKKKPAIPKTFPSENQRLRPASAFKKHPAKPFNPIVAIESERPDPSLRIEKHEKPRRSEMEMPSKRLPSIMKQACLETFAAVAAILSILGLIGAFHAPIPDARTTMPDIAVSAPEIPVPHSIRIAHRNHLIVRHAYS